MDVLSISHTVRKVRGEDMIPVGVVSVSHTVRKVRGKTLYLWVYSLSVIQ